MDLRDLILFTLNWVYFLLAILFALLAISVQPKDYILSVPMGVFLLLSCLHLFLHQYQYTNVNALKYDPVERRNEKIVLPDKTDRIFTVIQILMIIACMGILISRLTGKHRITVKKKRSIMYASLIFGIVTLVLWLIVLKMGRKNIQKHIMT